MCTRVWCACGWPIPGPVCTRFGAELQKVSSRRAAASCAANARAGAQRPADHCSGRLQAAVGGWAGDGCCGGGWRLLLRSSARAATLVLDGAPSVGPLQRWRSMGPQRAATLALDARWGRVSEGPRCLQCLLHTEARPGRAGPCWARTTCKTWRAGPRVTARPSNGWHRQVSAWDRERPVGLAGRHVWASLAGLAGRHVWASLAGLAGRHVWASLAGLARQRVPSIAPRGVTRGQGR